ncbi:MAG: trimethylamine methyltransferase family protein [Lentisphaerae bacterium]|nr:trimethylamine methyltransferase family protein [Lentisphaerota bacterium]
MSRQTSAQASWAGPLAPDQLTKLHNATLVVLEQTGLRVDCVDLHEPLERTGASVDRGTRVVKFPPSLVEATLAYLRREIVSGRKQRLLNGVTNPRWTPPLGCKFGGACIEYCDPQTNAIRPPTEQDLIRLLQLGEALPAVGFVGNPVVCLTDAEGRKVSGAMQRIKTAALVAKYTTKCGSTEVWNETELAFLVEIGEIVRGSREAYLAAPCFITAKETIAPLQFPAEDGHILLMLARAGLPATIIPMPITGGTCPCSAAANLVMANAEILGVLACLHAAVPEAIVGGGVISGVMDMATGAASFSAPEVLLQDAGLAQLYDTFYGQDLAIGTGYIDAKYPGAQASAEKALKMEMAARQGRYNFPVGLLAGGKRFSPVQALIDLELAEYIRRLTANLDISAETLALSVIQEVGIGGEFLSHAHTLKKFRRNLWLPELWDRTMPTGLESERKKDMVAAAQEKLEAIWNRDDLYQIDEERSRAIDEVVNRAQRVLQ